MGLSSFIIVSYVNRGLKAAREKASIALIIEMDIPGGLLDSTKEIVQAMLDSDDMPIVVYISRYQYRFCIACSNGWR